jgi:hypothetical protein
MANDVFANGREISCKKADGKSICAFPDVCMTPPENPATPPGVPVPYPNAGMAKDTTSGSKNVKISGQEVMLKNKSYFKKSTEGEAGSAAKKGVVTSVNRGKVYFNAWSMDVKFEGENVVRHLDLTTHNHGSIPGNSPTWPFIDTAAFEVGSTHACAKVATEVKNKCGKYASKSKRGRKKAISKMCEDPECKSARKCVLSPYNPSNCCEENGVKMTPHHIVPKHCFMYPGGRGKYDGCDGYNGNKAPCVCVTGKDKSTGDHKKIHDRFDPIEDNYITSISSGKKLAGTWQYQEAAHQGCVVTARVTKCDPACLREQVDAYHQQGKGKKPNIESQTSLRAESTGNATRNPANYQPAQSPVIFL